MAQIEMEQRHEAAQHAIHEALGVRLFKKPPEGFDPLQADDRELLVHGYPARPDKVKHPELHETWKNMVSRPLTIIEPQFALRTDKQHGTRNTIANDTSTNWSGAVSFAGKGDSATRPRPTSWSRCRLRSCCGCRAACPSAARTAAR